MGRQVRRDDSTRCVRKPGQLTLEFLAGRRARFISPLRLYLTASLVYFLLAETAPTAATAPAHRPPATAGCACRVSQTPDADGADRRGPRRSSQKQLESVPSGSGPSCSGRPTIRSSCRRTSSKAMPKALFALLPVFALILALFYRGRRFADHLYFAIHVHAFVFIALILNELTKFTHAGALGRRVDVVLLWLPLYGHLALRRVYGGSQMATLLKETGIGVLYAAASVPMWFLLALWVAGSRRLTTETPFSSSSARNCFGSVSSSRRAGTSGSLLNCAILPSTGRY